MHSSFGIDSKDELMFGTEKTDAHRKTDLKFSELIQKNIVDI